MATRNRTHGNAPLSDVAPGTRPARRTFGPDDERLNDDINGLLRDAAEQRERRTSAALAEDVASSRRQFDQVVALARARALKPRD
jgi:hypothetical protein